jgi:hypothetical protein
MRTNTRLFLTLILAVLSGLAIVTAAPPAQAQETGP